MGMSLAGVSVAGEDEIDVEGAMGNGLLLDGLAMDKVTKKIMRITPKIGAKISGERTANRLSILLFQPGLVE